MIIDDLQWGDLDSEPLLRELLESADTPGVMAIATLRTQDATTQHGETLADRLREQLRSGSLQRFTELHLTPLSEEDSTELVSALIGDEVSSDTVQQIIEEAAGSPLFVAELARGHGIAESGTGLQAIIESRVAALQKEARALLEACSLAAWPQPSSVLSGALRTPRLAQLVSQLKAERLIRVVPSVDGERLTTYHDRIREIVASQLSEQERSKLHKKLARGFERLGTHDVEALAIHWDGAGVEEKATRYALEAAARASAAGAGLRAAGHYDRALRSTAISDEEYKRVAELKARALKLAGAVEDAANLYLSLAERKDPGSKELISEMYCQAIICIARSGDTKGAISLVRRAGRRLGIAVPISTVLAIGSVFWNQFARWVTEKTGLFQKKPTPARQRRLVLMREIAIAFHLEPLVSWAIQHHYSREVFQYGGPGEQARAYSFDFGDIANRWGAHRFDEMLSIRDLALAAASDSGESANESLVHALWAFSESILMWRKIRTGGHDMLRHVEALRRNPAVASEAEWMIPWAMTALALAGAYAFLRQQLPAALRFASETGNQALEARLHVEVVAQLHLAADEPDKVLALLEDRGPRSATDARKPNVQDYRETLQRVEAMAYSGRPQEALDEMLAFQDWMRGSALAWSPVGTVGALVVAPLAAGLALTRCDGSAHRPIVDKALQKLRKTGHLMPEISKGKTFLTQALLALLEEDRAAAVRHLREASKWLHHCEDRSAFAVDFQLGELVGGAEKASLQAGPKKHFEDEQIANPERYVRWLCPIEGFAS